MLSTGLRYMIDDMALSFKEQFTFIEDAPKDKKVAYTAAIQDACIAVVNTFFKHISGFDADAFYEAAGYPGTRPVHKPSFRIIKGA